ncbi:carboxylesterase/lipase family protein [Yinghuangia seranimata]|uniref:carboxylesterase/lipase family protein n=1 Tax=Yinghuangia seranimata TaxID=408067 RepID=UPI00248CBDCD|nr:carboxylesterase family protein [Yinghuangia seranimata]MDI2125684.1 carboxylesterase family protein [Yinghuangia seranimata]
MPEESAGLVVATTGGRVEGVREGGLAVFRGIPFAAPPEGPLRFQAPAPAERWDGVRPAHAFGTPPPQLPFFPENPVVWQPSDGMDCLSVNVWTPGGKGDRLPVMVWIYGGGWKTGHSSSETYDGRVLARDGVVYVSFNYRVGFEGFGYVPGAPANRGFLDQAAALAWIRENIAGFGGDPDNVTIFGESGGGASVAALMTAPHAKGLFRRAIVQSMAGRYLPEEESRRISALICEAAGVRADELASVPVERLLAVQDAPLASMLADPTAWSTPEAITAFSPTVDGTTVVDLPWRAVRSGAASDIDLICGYTRDEFTLWSLQHGALGPVAVPAPGQSPPRSIALEDTARALGLDPSAPAAYRAGYPGESEGALYTAMYSDALFRVPAIWLAEAHTAAGGRAFLYEFFWGSPALGGVFGAAHAIDIAATFGHAEGDIGQLFFEGGSLPEEFVRISGDLRSAWTAFAAHGDPGWPRFTADEAPTRIWDVEPGMAADPIAPSRRIWRAHRNA